MLRWLLPTALAVAALAACAPGKQATFADDEHDVAQTKQTKPKPAAESPDASAPPPSADAAVTLDPFQGAAAFAEITPDTTTSAHHLGDSNAHRDCLACHGKAMGAPEFVLAGTIQKTASDPAPVSGVEVRVLDPSGTEVASVGTDENGNFWLRGTIALPAGSMVGIRDASGTKKMSATIAAGSCNQSGCHNQDRPIFVGE